jgi:hypothetical protein
MGGEAIFARRFTQVAHANRGLTIHASAVSLIANPWRAVVADHRWSK